MVKLQIGNGALLEEGGHQGSVFKGTSPLVSPQALCFFATWLTTHPQYTSLHLASPIQGLYQSGS